MKKIILFAFCVFFAISARAADYSFGAASNQKPCEKTEQSLLYEISLMGQQRTIEDHVKTARIYASIARHGCPNNSPTYKQMSTASLETARALVGVADYRGQDKIRYDDMINKAAVRNF
ncbi:MAG: hypothetical protein LBD94_00515 [Rickettsiales bacterium]|jgi:hypothetical protein|nr:hypothetical protein [Rickettsiales bacterium]